MKRKRRRSLSQLTPAETLSQLLLNLPGMAMMVVEFEISKLGGRFLIKDKQIQILTFLEMELNAESTTKTGQSFNK
jgi:hypothetical protein